MSETMIFQEAQEFAASAQVPLLRWLVPRQRRCTEAMVTVNATLDQLINKCKQLVRTRALSAPPC